MKYFGEAISPEKLNNNAFWLALYFLFFWNDILPLASYIAQWSRCLAKNEKICVQIFIQNWNALSDFKLIISFPFNLFQEKIKWRLNEGGDQGTPPWAALDTKQ